jgi:DNA-binding FadR family transcriptional regulator
LNAQITKCLSLGTGLQCSNTESFAGRTSGWIGDSQDNRSSLTVFSLQRAELSENPFFIKATKEVRDLCDLVGTWSHIDDERKYEAQEEHEKKLEKIKLRSLDGSLAQMKHHLSVICDKIIKNMNNIFSSAHVTDTPLA